MQKKISLVFLISTFILVVIVLLNYINNRSNVHLITPSEKTDVSVRNGLYTPPKADDIDGYTFIGWKTVDGNVYEKDIPIYGETFLSAQYAISFPDCSHPQFLSAQNSFFRPDDGLSRREAAIMLYSLLNTDLIGDGKFEDVLESDTCYTATALLKNLGIVEGRYFHPDDYLTENDFRELLNSFYPDSVLTALPSSEEIITRRSVARNMCMLLKRFGDVERDTSKVGIISDVSVDDPDYWYIAESCIEHNYSLTNGEECWTDSIPGILTDSGFFFVGNRLHFIDESGKQVSNTSIGHLQFNNNGEWTSGDVHLDKEIFSILEQTVDPASQTRIEMLEILYDYVRDNYDYCYGHDYSPGETGWANDEALEMINKKIGNCYRFAGLFCVLARSIGFDAEECCGVMCKDIYLHSWVEIPIDGEQRLFDPQYEARFSDGDPMYNRFNRGEEVLKDYNAMREKRSG